MAGSFRPKKYGLEYRVPCYDFFQNSSDVYTAINDAVDLYNSGDLEELIRLKGGEERIRSTINSGGSVFGEAPPARSSAPAPGLPPEQSEETAADRVFREFAERNSGYLGGRR